MTWRQRILAAFIIPIALQLAVAARQSDDNDRDKAVAAAVLIAFVAVRTVDLAEKYKHRP